MGKPVLLVDADLRNPVLHKLLQTDNERGLSNYLSGNAGVMELIHRTEIPGLFVMTTGPLPPNPVELIASTKMLTMLEQADEHSPTAWWTDPRARGMPTTSSPRTNREHRVRGPSVAKLPHAQVPPKAERHHLEWYTGEGGRGRWARSGRVVLLSEHEDRRVPHPTARATDHNFRCAATPLTC
jgi:hypothetical protein